MENPNWQKIVQPRTFNRHAKVAKGINCRICLHIQGLGGVGVGYQLDPDMDGKTKSFLSASSTTFAVSYSRAAYRMRPLLLISKRCATPKAVRFIVKFRF